MADRSILRVGLTGNIGAGKSTVGAMLQEHGCLLIDADRLARRVLEQDPEAHAEIVAALGREVLDQDGSLDRGAIAALIFSSTDARRRLESITHPRIRGLEERAVADWGVDRGIAVTEAALLVETGGANRYRRLVVVVADDEVRIQRLIARGMERRDVERRMAAQLPQEDKAAAAHWVIDNSGTREATRAQVEKLYERLEAVLEASAT